MRAVGEKMDFRPRSGRGQALRGNDRRERGWHMGAWYENGGGEDGFPHKKLRIMNYELRNKKTKKILDSCLRRNDQRTVEWYMGILQVTG